MGLHTSPSNEELTLNKLVILYMLNTIDTPITNTIITEFILENGYTNYFSLQEYIADMEDNRLIKPIKDGSKTLYSITDTGLQTLNLFENRIPDHIKQLSEKYLANHKYEIKKSVDIKSEYIPAHNGEYLVHCVAKENNRILLEINLLVYDKETAINMCERFETNNHDVYKSLLLSLSDESSL